jgi:hypothetical protein
MNNAANRAAINTGGYYNALMNFTSNLTNTTKEYTSGFSTTQIVLFIVVVLAAVAVLMFWWLKPKPDDVTVMGPFELKGAGNGVPSEQKVLFTQTQIDSSLGNNFTLSFFVYMDDSHRERIPLTAPEGDFNFKQFITVTGVCTILLDPIHQRAYISVAPLGKEPIRIQLDNVMVARWNQIALTLEGRTLDIYMNGVLAKSALLENLPILKPVMVSMETSPDFSGQAGLIQAWPRRLTASAIAANYKRNTDTRGKPLIPDVAPNFGSIWESMKQGFCDAGFCAFTLPTFGSGLQYIDYEFA